MKADIPSVKSFIDQILSLRQQQADLSQQAKELGKQVLQTYHDAVAAGIERSALLMALDAIKKRANAEKNGTADKLDATAMMANAYLGEYYGK